MAEDQLHSCVKLQKDNDPSSRKARRELAPPLAGPFPAAAISLIAKPSTVGKPWPIWKWPSVSRAWSFPHKMMKVAQVSNSRQRNNEPPAHDNLSRGAIKSRVSLTLLLELTRFAYLLQIPCRSSHLVSSLPKSTVRAFLLGGLGYRCCSSCKFRLSLPLRTSQTTI